MDPVTVSLIIAALQLLIKEYPTIFSEIKDLFSSGTPTDADFEALRIKLLSKSYKDYVPDSSIKE